MEQPRDEIAAAASALDRAYQPIRDDMAAVNEYLEREFCSGEPFLQELLSHVTEYRGKQMRPACVMLAGRWMGDITQEHISTAGVIELIHMATLVHDDLLDDAAIRRRVQTVNERWGERSAILLGDFLYSRAFTLAAEVPRAFGVLADTTHTVCRGELLQVGSSFNLALTEERYFQIIEQKTAVLYGLSCALGAHLAGCTAEQRDLFQEFGNKLGMAFQIADDALDLAGDQQVVGKSLGSDLKKGKMTLPMIRLREQLSAGKLEEYMWLLEHPNEVGTHQRVLTMLRNNGVLEEVHAAAVELVNDAIALLDRLPPHPLRESFEALAQFVVERRL
ncbi:MAG: polyprenyl synthetase family protein [Planctomycetota bacterium]